MKFKDLPVNSYFKLKNPPRHTCGIGGGPSGPANKDAIYQKIDHAWGNTVGIKYSMGYTTKQPNTEVIKCKKPKP